MAASSACWRSGPSTLPRRGRTWGRRSGCCSVSSFRRDQQPQSPPIKDLLISKSLHIFIIHCFKGESKSKQLSVQRIMKKCITMYFFSCLCFQHSQMKMSVLYKQYGYRWLTKNDSGCLNKILKYFPRTNAHPVQSINNWARFNFKS